MQYQLPEDTHKDWAGNQTRGFTPDERQQLVIEVVRRAIEDEGLYYTKDVYAFCVKQLIPTSDDLAKSAMRVQGGEVGMDLYYARNYLDARKRIAKEDQAKDQLRPHVGMVLGTLTLQDLKRCTGAVITAVKGHELTLQAKRGTVGICFTTTTLGLRYAMERAYERKQRKTSFAEFCNTLHEPIKAKRTMATTESSLQAQFQSLTLPL